MTRRHAAVTRRKVTWIGAVLVLALGVGMWWEFAVTPHVDAALERSVLPVVHDYLMNAPFVSGGPGTGMLQQSYPDLDPRWFGSERVIESRMVETRLRLGLVVYHAEFGHRGGTLVEGTGSLIPVVVTLSEVSGRYTVRTAEPAPDSPYFGPWVKRNFSPAGAHRVIDDGTSDLSSPAEQARRAFGLPADAPITTAN